MVKRVNYKLFFCFMSFVLLLSLVSAELNLKLTASVNGLSSDFNAITDPFAENEFDGFDVPFIAPPSNYISLYSSIPTQNGVNKLILDAWNQSSNPRTLNLTLFTSSAQAGNLVISWTGASGYSIVLNDYGLDSPRKNLVSGGSTNLSAGTGSGTYTVPTFSSTASGMRYFTLFVANTTSSVSDITPPGPVTNLGYSYKTKNSIFWVWANPTNDSDFDFAIVYADGVNVANTSLGKYNATGLAPNTTHDIRINTKDFVGNINYFNVTSSTMTSTTSTVITNPNPPLGPSPLTGTPPLGPGTGGAGTGTTATTGSSGGGPLGTGGEGPLGTSGGIAGDSNESVASSEIIEKTKDFILDFLSKKSNVYISLGIIASLFIVWLVSFLISRYRNSNTHKHIDKQVKKKR